MYNTYKIHIILWFLFLICLFVLKKLLQKPNSESMKNANKVNIVIVNLSQCLFLLFCIMIYDLFYWHMAGFKKNTPLLRYDICDEILLKFSILSGWFGYWRFL